MCKHCANLVEDKAIVHAFMERGAERISAKLGHPVDADWLDVQVSVDLPEGFGGSVEIREAALRIRRMLGEMDR